MRQRIINSAKNKVGIKFQPYGRSQNGLDCAGLITMVFSECDIKTSKTSLPYKEIDNFNYNFDISSYKTEPFLNTHLQETTTPQLGDLVLLSFDKFPHHLGILVDHPNAEFGIIHASITAQKIVYHSYNNFFRNNTIKFYKVI